MFTVVQIRGDFRGLYKSDVISTYLLPTYIGDRSRFWLYSVGHLIYLLLKIFNLFTLPIFWLWAYLMKYFPETRRAH
jgi:hypothetical protein